MSIILDHLGDAILDESSNPITDTLTVAAGSTAWGNIDSPTQDNAFLFAGHWVGTGAIAASEGEDRAELDTGEYLVSEVINTDVGTCTVTQNVGKTGDTVTVKYRTGATEAACVGASWSTYTAPFASSGYVQLWVENPA